MPGEPGDPDFDDDLQNGDLDDETFDEGLDPDADLGDDADEAGDGQGGHHSAASRDAEDGREEGQQVRQPSRAQARIERLDREREEALRRAAAAEERLARIEADRNRAGDAEREQERLAQMDPYERVEYFARRAESRTEQALNSLRSEMADSNDKATFAAACATKPALARIKDRVETTLAQLRANGSTAPRETIAAYLLGQDLLTKAPAARDKAEKKAAANRERERARPANGASDVSGGRVRDEKAARMARLESVQI